jgi:ABC-type transport system involved in multi-copper enzyme maturation permease subunit
MFAGPVCHFELVRAARRRRSFALRFGFGLVVLAIVAANYLGQFGWDRSWHNPGEVALGELARFGEVLFASVMAAQGALVLGLTPALVADAIAAERQQKTLGYLLASRLTSLEIVLGKLAARLMSVAVYPALALPIVSLLTLVGGVSPPVLVLVYAALAASAYLVAALALLASVVTRRPRDAVGAAYFLTAAWLFVPSLVEPGLSSPGLPARWRVVGHAVRVALDWGWPASPLRLLQGTGPTTGSTVWMAASVVAHATLLTALAAWLLRPSYRRHEGRAGRAGRLTTRARRWFTIRPCGDDPVFWKEAYFAPAAGGPVSRLARAGMFTLLALGVAGVLAASGDAFRELRAHGYGYGGDSQYQQRLMLNMGLRYGSALVILLWLLLLAGTTAAGITSEREQDTWTSLAATPLEGREILRGKVLGPLRATAPVGIAIGVSWLIGAALGAVHPLGLLNAAVVLALLVWFALALGIYQSLRSSVTWPARLRAQGILFVPQLCCLLPIPSPAVLMGISLWSYAEIHELPGAAIGAGWRVVLFGIAYYCGGIALYAGAAYYLTRAAIRRVDIVAGRPVPPHQRYRSG